MRVPLFDARRAEATIRGELESAFRRVLEGGKYILGPEVEAFERACAELLRAPHAIGVSSGTDALLVALMALGIGPGDEVICPTYTFVATAEAIARLGAKPVFADSCPRCGNLDPTGWARHITPATRAVLPVHLFGHLAGMESIARTARARGVAVVEDAAQAFAVRGVGLHSDLACFSFFPTKNLGALGDAGLVTARSDALADRVRALRSHGARTKYHYDEIGGNFRIDTLQAALLHVKLSALDAGRAARRENARLYASLLGEAGVATASAAPVVLPTPCQGEHDYHQYCVRAERRDELRAFLEKKGVTTAIYYPLPLHLQPCFAFLGNAPGSLPAAERLARESLALPIFAGLTTDEIAYVAAAVAEFYGASPRARPL